MKEPDSVIQAHVLGAYDLRGGMRLKFRKPSLEAVRRIDAIFEAERAMHRMARGVRERCIRSQLVAPAIPSPSAHLGDERARHTSSPRVRHDVQAFQEAHRRGQRAVHVIGADRRLREPERLVRAGVRDERGEALRACRHQLHFRQVHVARLRP